MYQDRSRGGAPATSANSFLELARLGEDKRTAIEAVAEAKGLSVQQVRREYQPDVKRVRAAMDEVEPEQKPERAKTRRRQWPPPAK